MLENSPINNEKNMQEKIDIEMVGIYLFQSRTAVYSAFGLVLFLAASFYQIAETKNIFIWVAAVLTIDAAILFTSLRFKENIPIEKVLFFKNRQQILHVLAGLAWGSACFLLLDPQNPQPSDYRVAAVIGIVIAFSASTMSASMRGLLGFVSAASVLVFFHFFANLDFFRWWFFGLMGLVTSCLFFGFITNKYITGLIENRLLNTHNLDELKALNQKVEANNLHLQQKNIDLEHMQKKLEKLATHDELTGLYNRRFILTRLREKLPELKRYHQDCSVVIVDIDHFKKVNDTFGHPAGDEVLRRFSQIFTRELRQGDILARYGGEEFMLMLQMTDIVAAEVIIERLRQLIAAQVYAFSGKVINVTASFGITEYANNDTIDTLIERADKALYQAKVTGRNRVVLITPTASLD
jgi:diguanylate cyclase (GGDEF)-like protein